MAPLLPWEDAAVQSKAVDAVVHVTREFPVPREQVFSAWIEPDRITQWFRPANGSSSAELDVRPGGRYRISVHPSPDLPAADIVGTYLEVVPPERLVYTFGWELPALDDLGGLADLEDRDRRLENLKDLNSLVTVRFRDLGGSTEVSITHERLATQGLRAFHIFGWESVLDNLADVV